MQPTLNQNYANSIINLSMAACFDLHFELNHVRNRQFSNGIMEMQEEKSHAKLIRVAIRPSNIDTFKQQKFALSQLLHFSNLSFELKVNVLFV